MGSSFGYRSRQRAMLRIELHRGRSAVDLATKVSACWIMCPHDNSRQPLLLRCCVDQWLTSHSNQYRRRLQPTLVDLHRHHVDPLPRGPRSSGQNTPPSLSQLDLPGRPLLRRPAQLSSRPCARMELLQPQFLRRRLCQLLHRAAHHGAHVDRVEDH